MPEGQMPFPGYFDQDALQFVVALVKRILGGISWLWGRIGG